MKSQFKTEFAKRIFHQKYSKDRHDTWDDLAERVVRDVTGERWNYSTPLMSVSDRKQLVEYIKEMKFIPGGRYLYYCGRPLSFWSNCFALDVEDTRESWASLNSQATTCLMMGGGVGVSYSKLRPRGTLLKSTGGIASGPLPLMSIVNEIGRNVQQGGSRRSALWAGLNWQHGDIEDFIRIKNWSPEITSLKASDFNFPAPLDMTNISIQFDDYLLKHSTPPEIWYNSVKQMCITGEPGHSYNFGKDGNNVLRNACAEFISDTSLDSCNLGSINLGAIDSLDELKAVVTLASKFLICGNIRGILPNTEAQVVRRSNNRIGLGLMGIHEWLIKRRKKYEIDEELRTWLLAYKNESERAADEHSDRFFLPRPAGYRSIAPSGTISILASTTGGSEPLYSIAYKRRYLTGGNTWKYEYVVDATAQRFIDEYINVGEKLPDYFETAFGIAKSPGGIERRIKFQHDLQGFVDMGISSTINLPKWGSKYNNEDTVKITSEILFSYMRGLRGITFYPDSSRGGQPLTEVPYEEAKKHKGVVFDESEEMKGCKDGVCGI